MVDVPTPSETPYRTGDRVRIHLDADDFDARYHGTVCEVVENLPDELGDLTGRELDRNHYTLRRLETGEELPLRFRHRDLVPAAEAAVDSGGGTDAMPPTPAEDARDDDAGEDGRSMMTEDAASDETEGGVEE